MSEKPVLAWIPVGHPGENRAKVQIVGWIVNCKHGSQFVQKKRVRRGECVNMGVAHNCK